MIDFDKVPAELLVTLEPIVNEMALSVLSIPEEDLLTMDTPELMNLLTREFWRQQLEDHAVRQARARFASDPFL